MMCSDQGCEDLPPGWRLISLSETDSSIDELVRRRNSDPGEGISVIADLQSAGRGRRGRIWQSLRGNLHLAVRLAQAETLASTAQLSFVAALSMAEALEDLVPSLVVRLKWPNDLLVGGAKVSGILLEADAPWVIMGIGVNLVAAPSSAVTAYPAASVCEKTGQCVLPVDLAHAFLFRLFQNVIAWRHAGFPLVRRRWLERASGLGEKILVVLSEGVWLEGIFADLDRDGALILQCPDGIRKVIAGDVYFPG